MLVIGQVIDMVAGELVLQARKQQLNRIYLPTYFQVHLMMVYDSFPYILIYVNYVVYVRNVGKGRFMGCTKWNVLWRV